MSAPPLATHVLCEARGRNEDAELELAFRRICDGDNHGAIKMPSEPVTCDKKNSSTGLQLADPIARPIGMHRLKPDQPNRAGDVILGKLDKNSRGHAVGHGLECFPLENKRPRRFRQSQMPAGNPRSGSGTSIAIGRIQL